MAIQESRKHARFEESRSPALDKLCFHTTQLIRTQPGWRDVYSLDGDSTRRHNVEFFQIDMVRRTLVSSSH